MLLHKEEAVDMLKAAIWCLQTDTTRRPSMSMVVSALEGLMDVDTISDYGFLTLIPMELPSEVHVLSENNVPGSTALLPSILSGPR
ncbi:hypothetical protein FRX31_014830 [Thalictrum thalictroides]|uniref:G-type lectin S-receptor-like serine/threonine-protein kinase n=1 Tax=Thalictrum thalictroides TaxID=46969 RepID=A0A7J6WF62_THATH|nr:hypothetical protein FRX31_014830 [Thalictrum thalictroides]